jgi:CRISPR-associated protein Cmr1
MQEVTFTLQTITPLFLAGNDQQEIEIPFKYRRENPYSQEVKFAWEYKAELRPPSFRGSMRYWQRAIVGGIVGTDDDGLAYVIKAEQDIFGATDRGSAVSIRISDVSRPPQKFTENTGIMVDGEYQATGKGYLFWSMSRSGKGIKYKPHRWYFPPDTTFKITLASHDQDPTKFNQAIASFWLLTSLGGVGSRSRRCAGSLMAKPLQPLTGDISNLPFKEPTNINELKVHLQNGIQIVRSLYPSLPQRPPREATFDVLSASTCKIWILSSNEKDRPWSSYEEAMTNIGEKLQAYRKTIKPPERRAVFGLPLIIRDLVDRRLKRELEGHRQASPLLLRITKLQNEYVCVAVLFKTQVQDIPLIPPQNYSLIEKWMSMFSRKDVVDL